MGAKTKVLHLQFCSVYIYICVCVCVCVCVCDEWGGGRELWEQSVELMIMNDTCATHQSRVSRRSSGRIKGGASTVEDKKGPGLDFILCFVFGSRP